MLIEFRVKNFRSLRDEQVLSLVASKDKTLQDTHTQATGISAAPAVLRSAVVYGANASGKSNLIKALQYMRGVVTESATAMQPSQTFAVQLNSESLRPLFDWFLNHLVIFNEQAQLSPQMSIELLKKADGRKEICNFLSSADISIADIDVETRKVPGQAIHFDLMAGKTEVRSEEMEEHKVLFHHVTEQGKAVFDIMDESNGTRNLLFLAAPVLNILNKGLTLVIDELDNSLHTLLVRELVRLFHRPEINTGGAQLIFTTHDTSLLDAPNLFRRDQVWFVEKDRDQTSTLVSLSEFSPRKNEALERGYLMGRYGGVPFLDHTLGLKH